MKKYIEFLKLPTNTCRSVFELSLLSSFRYKFFEKLEIAMIDKLVILKPVAMEIKVTMSLNALSEGLAKIITIANRAIEIMVLKLNIFFIIF